MRVGDDVQLFCNRPGSWLRHGQVIGNSHKYQIEKTSLTITRAGIVSYFYIGCNVVNDTGYFPYTPLFLLVSSHTFFSPTGDGIYTVFFLRLDKFHYFSQILTFFLYLAIHGTMCILFCQSYNMYILTATTSTNSTG